MKKIFVLFFLIIGLGCRKDKLHNAQKDIIGSWELRKSEGGIGGTIVYPPGNGNIYQFNSDGSYNHITMLSAETGIYQLMQSSTSGQWLLKMISSGVGTHSVTIDDNQLVFLPDSPCCDQPTDTYSRL